MEGNKSEQDLFWFLSTTKLQKEPAEGAIDKASTKKITNTFISIIMDDTIKTNTMGDVFNLGQKYN